MRTIVGVRRQRSFRLEPEAEEEHPVREHRGEHTEDDARGDRFPIQVDSGDCAACSKSEMQGRAARTTRHIQKPGRAMQFKPRRKAFKLVDCQPTVLTDVLPKSRTPNTCVDLCRELSVLATVMTRNLRLISDRPSLRRISQTARRQDTNVGHGSGMTGDTAYSGDRRRL